MDETVIMNSILAVLLKIVGNLSKTAEDGDGNVGKTIKLITQDKSAREYVK